METNPYAPPQVTELSAPRSSAAEAEAIRQEHIKVEAAVKSVGTLYYLGLFLFGILGVTTLFAALGQGKAEDIGVGIFFLVIAIAQGFLAYGLRRLRSWARWPAVVLSGIGLLGFPLGTLINAVVLYYLLGAKPNMVFSPGYKDIIATTPHVKYKSSVVAIVLLVILIIVLIGVVASVMMN